LIEHHVMLRDLASEPAAAPARKRKFQHPRVKVRAVGVALVALLAACDSDESREVRRVEGQRLFEEQGCAVCHGPAGRGDGPRARALNPPPRDFRQLDAYVQGTGVRELAATLQTGIRVHDAQMPSFGHLSERQRRALAEFIVWLREAPAAGSSRSRQSPGPLR
jgi:mono/diheme cytochrome c family protein